MNDFLSSRRLAGIFGWCLWNWGLGVAAQPLPPASVPACNSAAQTVSAAHRSDILPNIILINLDDADREGVEVDFLRQDNYDFLPHIDRLAREGLRFTNMHATTPLCGPSRACLFTGQYAHKHGIKNNDPLTEFARGTTGGYNHFRQFGAFGDRQTPSLGNELGVWMKQAGYHTMFVGKYLHNGYEPKVGETWSDVHPPGWDEFFVSLGASYYTTTFVRNGVAFQLASADATRYPVRYRTAVESVEAVEMIRQHVQERTDPFFLSVSPLAPHRETHTELCFEENQPNRGMVEPKYRSWWNQLQQIRGPDFDEPNMQDKPAPLRGLPPLESTGDNPATNEILQSDVDFRRRLLSLRSVDDLVANLFQTLEELDLVDQTIIILTSDHGYHLGQNRILGKKTPFHRCTNVPLFVWGPGYFSPDATPRTHLLANIDLAPTLLQLAGQPIPPSIQGKSFYPVLIKSYQGSAEQWRPDGILVEHWESNEFPKRFFQSTYVGVRTHDTIYTEWASGDREFYNLTVDPYQLENRSAELTAEDKAHWQARLALLRNEMPEPASCIEQPLFQGDVFFRKVEISGFSEYKTPLKHIKLTIADITNPQEELFWDGNGWTSDYSFVLASMTNKGGIISNWNYAFQPPANGERKYRVTVRATAADGAFQTQPTARNFTIDSDQPVCQITTPRAEEVVRYYKPITLAGWARDDDGIRSVRVTIRDSKSKKFWNGSQWQETPISLVPRMLRSAGSVKVNWSYDFSPPQSAGTVYVNIRPYDLNGDTDESPRGLRFYWGK